MDLILLVGGLMIIYAIIYLLTTLPGVSADVARIVRILSAVVLLLYALSRVFPLPNVLPR